MERQDVEVAACEDAAVIHKDRFAIRFKNLDRTRHPRLQTFFLHAGMPKTGATSIQNTLYKCRELLLEKEHCLYPDVGAKGDGGCWARSVTSSA